MGTSNWGQDLLYLLSQMSSNLRKINMLILNFKRDEVCPDESNVGNNESFLHFIFSINLLNVVTGSCLRAHTYWQNRGVFQYPLSGRPSQTQFAANSDTLRVFILCLLF